MAKSDTDKLLKKMKDEDIKFLDLRFTDPKGKLQHVTFHSEMVDEDLFEDGTMFDGSSIEGWKAINESDMVLMPDASTAKMDPFFQQDTLAVFCDILEPDTNEAYNRDPRYEGGNMGHRPHAKGGYFPVPPIDHEQDMRSEMLSVMDELGLRPEKHHHEVAPSQHELGMKFAPLLEMGDNMQLYKYIVHNVANAYGRYHQTRQSA